MKRGKQLCKQVSKNVLVHISAYRQDYSYKAVGMLLPEYLHTKACK